jgi:hypothetical protein
VARLTLRRLGPWLLGLFVVAQAAGVLPLMFDHTFHVYEGQRTETHDHSVSGRHGDHRHGSADVKDECCWIKDLTGIAGFHVGIARTSFAATRTVSEPAKVLVSNAPDRLDRPPKPLSLI